jgi:hypothetical protein
MDATHACPLTRFTSFRLVTVAIILAFKFVDDYPLSNAGYAKLFGIPLTLLATLESRMLFAVDFSLFMRLETQDEYYRRIHSIICSTNASGRSTRMHDFSTFLAATTSSLHSSSQKIGVETVRVSCLRGSVRAFGH